MEEQFLEYQSDTIKKVWSGMENKILLLTMVNIGLIYSNISLIPLAPALVNALDTSTYEDMAYDFKLVYTLQNKAHGHKKQRLQEGIEVRSLHTLLKDLDHTILAVSGNIQFANARQADPSIISNWDKLISTRQEIKETMENRTHLAVLLGFQKRRDLTTLTTIAESVEEMADKLKDTWQLAYTQYLDAKDILR